VPTELIGLAKRRLFLHYHIPGLSMWEGVRIMGPGCCVQVLYALTTPSMSNLQHPILSRVGVCTTYETSRSYRIKQP
jgi:hypothetical protein